ncbi:MAG: flagellar hook-basal body protein [Lachnospiraceae bacterium]|nr:flagellar hook-basal body protein [Lachnospiraceae bacterium]
MVKGLYTANWGMINEQKRVDILANNMANAATTGYKKEGSTSESFHDMMAYKINDTSEPGVARKLGGMNMGVKIGEVYTDYSQGSIHETGNTFDMALSDKGFFAVEFTNKKGETSTKYTRDGNFTLNIKGEVVNKNGDFLLNKNGAHIVLDPMKEASIDRYGQIYQDGQMVHRIEVVDFVDYDYLEKYGENYYNALEGSEIREPNCQVYSGYLEDSNVQVVQEMVDLINFTRAYETNQKMIQTMDSTLDKAVNNLGRVR